MKNYNSDFGDCENCRNLKMNKRSRTQIDASKKDDEARKRADTLIRSEINNTYHHQDKTTTVLIGVTWKKMDCALKIGLCGPITRASDGRSEYRIIIPFMSVCLIACKTPGDAIRRYNAHKSEWNPLITKDSGIDIDIKSLWNPGFDTSQSAFGIRVADLCEKINEQFALKVSNAIRHSAIDGIVVESRDKLASIARLTERIEIINREIREMEERAQSIIDLAPPELRPELTESLKRIRID